MLAKFKAYGYIAITASAFLGASYWWTRATPAVTAQDLASCYAAFAERQIAWQTGTNAACPDMSMAPASWSWSYWSAQTNYPASGVPDDEIAAWYGATGRLPHAVTAFLTWETLYDRLLCGLRSQITEELSGIYWVDPATWPEDGAVVSSVNPEWNNYQTTPASNGMPAIRKWVMLPSSNGAAQAVGTVGTRKALDGVRYVGGMDPDRMPVSEWFWGKGSVFTNPAPWTMQNWWSDKLPGVTDVYSWACEYRPADGQTVYVSLANPFSADPGALFFSFGSWSDLLPLTVSSLSSETNRLYAAIATLTSPGLSDQTFAVSDGSGALTLPIYVSARYLSLTEGGSASFNVHLNSNPGAVVQVTASYSGTGGHLGYTFLLFTASNWSVDQSVTFYADADADTANGAGIITLTYQGIATQIAVGIADDDGPADIVVDPLVVLSKGGSDIKNVSLTHAPTNFPVYLQKYVMATNLVQARAVLTNLTTTLALFHPDQLIVSSSNQVAQYWQFNDSVSETNLDYDIDSAFSGWSVSRPDPALQTNLFSGLLLDADIRLIADQQEQLFSFGPPEVWLYSSAAYWQESTWLTTFDSPCRLPYPSGYACASGKVARVRIYAAVECSACDKAVTDPSSFQITDDQAARGWSVDVEEDPAGVSWYSDKCKIVSEACGFGDTVFSFNASTCDVLDGTDPQVDPQYPSEIKMVLLADVSDPAECPSFTFPLDAFEPLFSDFHGTSWTVYSYDLADRPAITRNWVFEYRNIVSVKYFAVLVDWRWQHTLQPGGYNPDPYTPVWATDNVSVTE